jgi:hypothetical protein
MKTDPPALHSPYYRLDALCVIWSKIFPIYLYVKLQFSIVAPPHPGTYDYNELIYLNYVWNLPYTPVYES